jgi:dihydroneopterin aldolase
MVENFYKKVRATMDKIIISNLLTAGIIGVDHPERDQPQSILINLTLYLDTHKAGKSDNILDTVNYAFVSRTIKDEVSISHFFTVEALAEHLADYILSAFSVKFVKLKVEKPNAVKSAQSVGVEIVRSKNDNRI